MSYIEDTGEVTLIYKENELEVEWKMDFNSLSEEVNACHCSPHFSFQGTIVCIGIYLNSIESRDTLEQIGVDLYRHYRDLSGSPINLAFSFAFKTVNGQEDVESHGTGILRRTKSLVVDRFISKSDFDGRKPEFLDSGFLTVVCTLQRFNSKGKA